MVKQQQTRYESFTDQLDKMTGLSEDGKNWYQVEYASIFSIKAPLMMLRNY